MIEYSAETGSMSRLSGARAVAPLEEVEVELLNGDPEALFVVASRIARASSGNLRLLIELNLERALRIGTFARRVKYRIPALASQFSSAELLSSHLAALSHEIVAAPEAIVEFGEGDGLCRLRVALRRLRTIERLYRKRLPGYSLGAIAAEAKRFSEIAGEARDLDLFATKCAALAPALLDKAEAAKVEALHRMARAIASPEYQLFALAMLEAAAAGRWLHAAEKDASITPDAFARRSLSKFWTRLFAAGNAADFSAPHTPHSLRLAPKRFRYALKLFRASFNELKTGALLAQLAALQTSLGAVSNAISVQTLSSKIVDRTRAANTRSAGFIGGCAAAEAIAAAAVARAQWEKLAESKTFWVGSPNSA